ncbi:Spore maturation protein A [Posidoniimonas polymericola]|uniref:Spore maturation protein A n=1 Tax=Posidoniimonas polymericola TaxID=2528002 RepID=A0A5C5YTY7_9BACT|nr:nucleoside recognition domain-containing protein [Posidoniimonas polymericola]TWT78445.1 Spore maturation protein A [Posidoniimonas polymericola]
MLNRIWFWLLFIGIVYGFGKGVVESYFPPAVPAAVESDADAKADAKVDADSPGEPVVVANPFKQAGQNLTTAAIEAAEVSVTICLNLIGVMILWLGILQVAKDAGMVDALARLLRPLMRWLFPDVPDGHPAQGAMLMNISANMLGLDNAATPFGLKAMKELQELNSEKETATNSMATFLAINTSSVTLVPISVIALRSAAGGDPAAPVAGILLATIASTIAAVIAVRWLSKLPAFSDNPPPLVAGADGASGVEEDSV